MKSVFKLFACEFKNIYKQALIFALISTFLFALSISVMCFSSDMVQGYKDWVDEVEYYDYLGVYNVTDFDKYKELDGLCDYLYSEAYGITERYKDSEKYAGATESIPMLQNGDNTSGYAGGSYVFREELPPEMADGLISGSYGGAAANERRENGQYPVYVSDKTAEQLEVSVGDSVILNYELKDGNMYVEKFTVAGVYAYDDAIVKGHFACTFIIPFAFVYEHKDSIAVCEDYSIIDSCNVYLLLNKSSDAMDLLPKIKRINAGEVWTPDDIVLVNTMRYILIVLAVAIVVVTFVVLSNSLTITLNSRKKFMAKLKLLGATTDKITAAYFMLLIVSFIVAFALSILLSYLLCGYFTSIATVALEYKVTMKLHFGTVGILFAVGCALLAVRYALFRKKVKRVSPAEFIKED